MGPTVRVDNIVASVLFEREVDLDLIELSIPDAEPLSGPSGVVIRIYSPRATALVFRTGKMIVSGSRSSGELVRAVKKILGMLEKAGIRVGRARVQIHNVVATCDLGSEVLLDRAADIIEGSIYEPEQFPGLVAWFRDPRAAILIFPTGKMIITGVRSEAEAELVASAVHGILLKGGCLIDRNA